MKNNTSSIRSLIAQVSNESVLDFPEKENLEKLLTDYLFSLEKRYWRNQENESKKADFESTMKSLGIDIA